MLCYVELSVNQGDRYRIDVAALWETKWFGGTRKFGTLLWQLSVNLDNEVNEWLQCCLAQQLQLGEMVAVLLVYGEHGILGW